MFTGIVEEVGSISFVEFFSDGSARLTVQADRVLGGTVLGDSICVNGVCLTVTDLDGTAFSVDVMAVTLATTTFGAMEVGSRVNLERAATASTRLGGHFVTGHVDGQSTIIGISPADHWSVVRFQTDEQLAAQMAKRGSVTVDGTSLTISDCSPVQPNSWFEVSLIPTTLRETTLGERSVGQRVNIETDVLAKYVQRSLEVRQ